MAVQVCHCNVFLWSNYFFLVAVISVVQKLTVWSSQSCLYDRHIWTSCDPVTHTWTHLFCWATHDGLRLIRDDVCWGQMESSHRHTVDLSYFPSLDIYLFIALCILNEILFLEHWLCIFDSCVQNIASFSGCFKVKVSSFNSELYWCDSDQSWRDGFLWLSQF